MNLKKILKDSFTETDNETFDISKFLAFISIVIALVLTIHSYSKNGFKFDIESYGIGIGVLFGGLGLALGLKKDSGEKEFEFFKRSKKDVKNKYKIGDEDDF